MGARVSSSTHGTLLALRHARCIVINAFFFGDNADRFGFQNVYSMAPLQDGADLEVEDSLGNWEKFILLDIPSLSFVRGEFPQISPSI